MEEQKNLVVKYWDFTKPMICQTFQAFTNKKVAFIFRESFINKDTLATNDSYKKLLGVVNDESTEATSWKSEITDDDDLAKIVKRTEEVIEDYDINDPLYNGVRLSLAVSDTLNGANVSYEKYIFKKDDEDNTVHDLSYEKESTDTGSSIFADGKRINTWGGYDQKIVQAYYDSKKPKVEITFPTEASDTDKEGNPLGTRYPYKKEIEYDKNTTTLESIEDKFYHFVILKITRTDEVEINTANNEVVGRARGELNIQALDINGNDISSEILDWDFPLSKVAWSCCEKPIALDEYEGTLAEHRILDNMKEYELIEDDSTEGEI